MKRIEKNTVNKNIGPAIFFGVDMNSLKELGYQGIEEKTYTSNHPEVLYWTHFFCERFQTKQIFEKFERKTQGFGHAKAVGVGTQWHRFSAFMPWTLCRAASQVSTNRMRHYVIQTAFEELGMRKENEIHHEMFRDTTYAVGLTENDHIRLAAVKSMSATLEFLQKSLISMKTDAPILGLLLGLECPARENIETIFSSLAYRPELKTKLEKTLFFKFHRALEIEHIRLTVSNFLRFCKTEKEKKLFIHGFDLGIEFWARYWRSVGQIVAAEKRRLTK